MIESDPRNQLPALLASWGSGILAFGLAQLNLLLGLVCGIGSILATAYSIMVSRQRLKRLKRMTEEDEEDNGRKGGTSATLTLLLLVLTSGCGSILPTTKRTETSQSTAASANASHAATIQRSLEVPSSPLKIDRIQVSGSSNSVTIAQPAAPVKSEVSITGEGKVNDQAKDRAYLSMASTIPMGVNIALIGIGLLILTFAVRYAIRAARNGSAAARAAFDAADQLFSHRIRALRDRVSAETDAATLATLNAQLAALNEDRGRLASQRTTNTP